MKLDHVTGWVFLAAVALFGIWHATTGKVRGRSRAAGVDPRLLEFLTGWEVVGGFPILVADGLRTDPAKQLAYFEAGNSRARTLDQTPHGRGGAVDLWPADFNPNVRVTAEVYEKFLAIGIAAENAGLEWGGRWTNAFRPSDMNPFGGDLPHVQVRNWASLPFPPEVSA